jgi:prephenate dehydrogenase
MQHVFQHVVIVGCGLLGTSLGLALRNAGLAKAVTGVGRRGSPSVSTALRRGAIDRSSDDAARAVSGLELDNAAAVSPADLIIICTPLRQFPAIFSKIAPHLSPGAIVTDVGSVKSQVLQWAAEILPAHAHFVGSHPMAGSEQSGPDAADAALYKDALCIVCPNPAVPEATARVVALWQSIGMRIGKLAPDLHDQFVAIISHLPHITAALLVNTAAEQSPSLELAAGGFLDTTRIASGDVAMWTDILLTNRAAILEALDRFTIACAALRSAIAAGEEGAITEKLTLARAMREKMLDRRKNAGTTEGA